MHGREACSHSLAIALDTTRSNLAKHGSAATFAFLCEQGAALRGPRLPRTRGEDDADRADAGVNPRGGSVTVRGAPAESRQLTSSGNVFALRAPRGEKEQAQCGCA